MPALTAISTTYDCTFSKTLAHYLVASELDLYGGTLYSRVLNAPADSLMDGLVLAMGQIEGVTAESHTYYGAVVHVEIECAHDTTATRRKVRDLILGLENAVRNITRTRFHVDGLEFADPDSNYMSDGQFAPFRVFDPEAQDYVGSTYSDRAEAQIMADLHNLALMRL